METPWCFCGTLLPAGSLRFRRSSVFVGCGSLKVHPDTEGLVRTLKELNVRWIVKGALVILRRWKIPLIDWKPRKGFDSDCIRGSRNLDWNVADLRGPGNQST